MKSLILLIYSVVVSTTLLAPSGCSSGVRDDPCPVPGEVWQGKDFDASLLRCERVPELCGLPVTSLIREPNFAQAVDIVFVGDGYTEESIDAYREKVNTFINELTADREGIVGRDPSLFNFHRVDPGCSYRREAPQKLCWTRRGGGRDVPPSRGRF